MNGRENIKFSWCTCVLNIALRWHQKTWSVHGQGKLDPVQIFTLSTVSCSHPPELLFLQHSPSSVYHSSNLYSKALAFPLHPVLVGTADSLWRTALSSWTHQVFSDRFRNNWLYSQLTVHLDPDNLPNFWMPILSKALLSDYSEKQRSFWCACTIG